MLINFTKMHGLGNDFIVVDNMQNDICFSKKQICHLANRNFGIGFDQLLIVGKSTEADFSYTIYNADGSLAEQCGNGACCFARFVTEKKLTTSNHIFIETTTGLINLTINTDKSVCVNMGRASFVAQDSGFLTKVNNSDSTYLLDKQKIGVVCLGNPHAVIIVNELDCLDIKPIASAIQNNKAFINSVNVGFMQIISKNEIKLRVYERGVGETLACGSGACAALAYGLKLGMLDNEALVNFKGGKANIGCKEDNNMVFCILPESVFEGRIDI